MSKENCKVLLDMMHKAKDAGAKNPVILQTENGQPIRLRIATAGRFRASIAITDGEYDGKWFGTIHLDGKLFRAKDCTDEVFQTILALRDDPASIATHFGRGTGRCCFCGRTLTDKKSDPKQGGVGYGPICADRYGLPHGAVTVPTDFVPGPNPCGEMTLPSDPKLVEAFTKTLAEPLDKEISDDTVNWLRAADIADAVLSAPHRNAAIRLVKDMLAE